MWTFSCQDLGVHKIAKKTYVKFFFSIFQVKYFFNKRTVTQTFRNPVNITGTLPGKLKIIFLALSYKIYLLKSQKCEKLLFGGYFVNLGTNGIQWFFMILWISEIFSFNFKLGFFTYFEYISGGIIRKNILRSDYHGARWYWCKKDQKNLPQTSHKIFFSRRICEFFIVMSIYGSRIL